MINGQTHQPRNRYECPKCTRCFRRLEHLQRHDRSHTKEQPYGCRKCEKAFTRKDLLTRHERLKHSQRTTITYDHRQVSQPFVNGTLQQIASLTSHALSHSEPQVATFGDPALPQSEFQSTNPTFSENSGLATSGAFMDDLHGLNAVNSGPCLASTIASAPFTVDWGINDITDFESYIDSIPLSTNPYGFGYYTIHQPLPRIDYFPPRTLRDGTSNKEVTTSDDHPGTLPEAMRSRLGSRLPSLDPEMDRSSNPASHSKRIIAVSQVCREKLVASLSNFSNVLHHLNHLTIPSRHALTRFTAAYVTFFHQHYPFLHIPTIRMDQVAPELLLALASLGAQYCREPVVGLELFQISKTITMERIRRRSCYCSTRECHPSITPPRNERKTQRDSETDSFNLIEVIQSLVILTAISMWFRNDPYASEALYIRSVLDALIRESGLLETEDEGLNESWQDWAKVETAKRTKLIGYCFFNLQTIVFDLPPMLLTENIGLTMPCTEKEWQADSECSWLNARVHHAPEPAFRDSFHRLLDPSLDSDSPAFSSFGGYMLIQAIIQHIWMLQKSQSLPKGDYSNLTSENITKIECALNEWCQGWIRNYEASVDPMSPYGPLSFTSTALLRLAYIRINMDVNSARLLSTWDPDQIAQSIDSSICIERSDRITKAALHCAHALSIPIKLGINFVARNQVILWSNQHALSSFECALLLAKWLQVVTALRPRPPLTLQEIRLVSFVVEMVGETEYKASREQLLQNNTTLSGIILRLWAKLFITDHVWEMVDLIGKSLARYADLLETS